MTKKHILDIHASETSEIGLSELWQLLIQYKGLVLGAPILCITIAFVITSMLKPQWEAIAVLQTGKVVQKGMTEANGAVIWNREPIESASHVFERIKLKQFQNDVLNRCATFDREKSAEILYHDSLKARVLANDLIEIKVRGYSREEARYLTESTVNCIRKIHDGLTKPTVQRLNQQLIQIRRQIEKIHNRQSNLLKADLKNTSSPGEQYIHQIFTANVISQQDHDLQILEQIRTTYEEQLFVLYSNPTKLIGDVFVENKPVAPKKVLIIMTVGLISLFFSLFVAFFMRAVNAKKNSEKDAF